VNRGRLYIIASCTNRKRLRSDASLQLRALDADAGSIDAAVERWWTRLADSDQAALPARQVYAGDHWSVVSQMPTIAMRDAAALLVASAGYGLISSDTPIHGYSATFTPGHPDSIQRFASESIRGAELARCWWKSINTREVPGAGRRPAIGGLVEDDVEASLLVIGSTWYIEALGDDLAGVRGRMADPRRLVIVSSEDTRTRDDLRPNIVPCSSHLRPMLGGTLSSLHARVARTILSEAGERPLDAWALRERYSSAGSSDMARAQVRRQVLSDSEVRQYIGEVLAAGRTCCHTALLRELRASGRACEQARFRKLYREVLGGGMDG